MDTLSFLIGIGGIMVSGMGSVIAGVSVYLTYRARTAPYREALYSQHLEMFRDVFVALSEHRESIYNAFFNPKKLPENSQSIRTLITDMDGKDDNLYRAIATSMVFLPKHTTGKIAVYLDVCAGILSSVASAVEQGQPINRRDNKKLFNAYAEAINAARKDLHIESLTQEMYQAIERKRGI